MNSFLPEKPPKIIRKPLNIIFRILEKKLGKDSFSNALNIDEIYPVKLIDKDNTNWLKNAKIIGINPRIIGSYFNIVKYALTFPEDTIHIMPVWETGCDGGIYARINWKLANEWIDEELTQIGYDTAEKQLKLVVNLLHALGKKVGFDMVCHTDKFSEEVFVMPECFEWIKLNPEKTKEILFNDTEDVYPLLKNCIINFLKENGSATEQGSSVFDNLYSDEVSYEQRSSILFGIDYQSRISRRIDLMNYVRNCGFETIPVTEHAPSRPIKFDCIHQNENTDYAIFKVLNKSNEAKIFNSITPYRWYKIDNNGYPNPNKKIPETFKYVFEMAATFQKKYGFDFLRADMGHNQLSHSHCNPVKNKFFEYEFWRQMKKFIQDKNNVPYFGVLGEAFLGDYYIDGITDMINKDFDIILGISNTLFLNNDFIDILKSYSKYKFKYSFCPCLTSITNDSDREENNKFYESPMANEIRYFIQIFFSLPAYSGMGFELRNLKPQSKYEYSGYYTNYQPKNYEWGKNNKLFNTITKIRKIYSNENINNNNSYFLTTFSVSSLCWIIYDKETKTPLYLCVVNLNHSQKVQDIYYETDIDLHLENKILVPVLSLKKPKYLLKTIKACSGCINSVDFGDARIYKFVQSKKKIFNKKNKNQILIVSTEFSPYAKSGGLADFCSDFSWFYRNKYPNADIRIIIPLYNLERASFSKGNSYIELFGSTKSKPIKFKIKETKIETDFRWGVNSSKIKLYKADNKKSDIQVYFACSEEYSYAYKEYFCNLKKFAATFSSSVCAILKLLKKYENFNPYLIITNDYLCANIIPLLKSLKKIDNFYENYKTIHIIHNIIDEGKIPIFNALSRFFDTKLIELICKNTIIGKILEHIAKINNIDGSYFELIEYIDDNFEKVYQSQKDPIDCLIDELSYLFENKLDKDYMYNLTQAAITCTDCWLTVSDNTYKSIVSSNKYPEYYKKYKYKGCGILSGINPNRYNPESPSELYYPYSLRNVVEGKTKNKQFIQNVFSKENIANCNYPENLFTNFPELKIKGYLNSDSNALLLLFAARPNIVKGFELLKLILPDILGNNNIQVIIASEAILNSNMDYFTRTELNKYFENGKLLVIDNFVNIKQFFASSDIYLMPSLIETCGLAMQQAMRYGSLPVISNTGAAAEIINGKNGFIAEESFFDISTENAAIIYFKLLQNAIMQCSDINIKNEYQYNAMATNVAWNDKNFALYNQIFNKLKEH